MKKRIKLAYSSIIIISAIAAIIIISNLSTNTVGFMGRAEQLSITNAQFVEGAPAQSMIRLTVRNDGYSSINIIHWYLWNNTENSESTYGVINFSLEGGYNVSIPKGSSSELSLVFPNSTVLKGSTYTIIGKTAKGTTFLYSLTSENITKYDPNKDLTRPTPFESPPEPFWTTKMTTILIGSLTAALISIPITCKIACYAVNPKNKKELVILLFLTTLIVVLIIIYIVNAVFFPQQISY
jgi:hypothetical protein